MHITQDGPRVTGTMETDEGFAALEGSIEGSDVEYVVTVNDGGNVLEWVVSGRVDGQEMHGTFDGEETGPGDWVAVRAR